MILWTEKYRPRSLSELVGNQKAIESLRLWANQWRKGVPEKRAALLYGPPGSGKTSAAHALAHDMGWDILELNASDDRSSARLERIVGSSLSSLSVFGRRTLILLDEVDGIAGREDAGGLSKIIDYVQRTRTPMILTANDIWDQRLAPLRDLCLLIEFKQPSERDIVTVLKRIAEREGIRVDYSVLKAIAQRSGGDFRAAINDFQAIAEGKKVVTMEDVRALGHRDVQYTIFQTVGMILKGTRITSARAALWNTQEDPETVMFWLAENLPKEYKKPEDLARAYDRLSKADVYLGRIIRRQYWGLLSYASDLMSAGVALAKSAKYPGFTKYSYPSFIKMMGSLRSYRELRDSIARKIANKTHSSTREAREMIPILKFIAKVNPTAANRLFRYFGFDSDEINFLRK